RLNTKLLLHHEALAIVIVDGAEIEAELAVAAGAPGRVAREHVDFAGLQRREAVLGGEGRVFHLGGVAEDCGRYSLAEIDVETGPVAGRILGAEAGEVRAVDAALHETLGLEDRKSVV